MSYSLEGKRVVVTGGASGIGAATAQLFAAHGARIALGYHSDAGKAEAMAASLAGNGHFAIRMKIDDAGSLAEAAKAIGSKFGEVDVLINSAGRTVPVPAANLDDLTDELFDEITRVNLRGPFAVIRTLAPLLKAAPQAAVINIGSVAATTGTGSNLAYCASKAGVHTLTIALAKVMGPSVRVMTVSPGAVDTEFVKGRAPGALEKIAANTPLKKVTDVGAVADAVYSCVVHLTSSTGVEIIVDEGRHLP
ncbi:SDR family oxidoreductase [Hoeflea sp. CAU 1731]